MRRILRDTCIFAALMIFTVFAFSIAGVGFTEEIRLVFELFGLAFILAVINYVIDEKTSFPILTGYLVKYLVVVGVVIVFGFIAGWFYPSNFWMAFIYVGIVTVVVYALDSVRTEKDIEEINEMVKLSNNDKVEQKPLKNKKGWKVLLGLAAAMTVLGALSLAGYFCFAKYDSDLRSQHKEDAEASGYDKVYVMCSKEDNAVIDGAVYECYRSREWMFAGDISSREVMLYFEYGTAYIDGTGGDTENLRIYCRDTGNSYDEERMIEPYSIYNEGMTRYENYCLDGFVAFVIAAVFLGIALAVYLAAYLIRRKNSGTVLP